MRSYSTSKCSSLKALTCVKLLPSLETSTVQALGAFSSAFQGPTMQYMFTKWRSPWLKVAVIRWFSEAVEMWRLL